MGEPDLGLLRRALTDAASSGEFILRARCAELESVLAREHGYGHCVVSASPHHALLLILSAAGVASGDTVQLGGAAPGFAEGVARRLGARAVAGLADPAEPPAIDGAAESAYRVSLAAGAALVLDLGPGSPAAGIAEAAAVLTDDGELATRVRMLRNHGQDGRTRFLHHELGFNARMDEVAAAYLLARRDGGRPGGESP